MAGKEVNFDIVAKDKASDVLDDVADKAETVEKSDPTVDVKADTKAADHTLEGFADQLDRLTADDKAVVVALRAGAAQTELRDLAGDLAVIDASDPELDVKFARYAEVSGQLDQLETQLKDLGTTGGANLDHVSDKLDGIGGSASNAQGAVHSMAGNAVGDFAATATGIGPLGEALGQLTEAAAETGGSFKEMLTAGAAMGGIAVTMYIVQKTMKAIADTKAFHKEEVVAYTESIKDGESAVYALNARLRETGKVTGSPSITNASNFLGLSDAVRDVTETLTAAGLNIQDYTALVTGSKEDVVAWGQAQKDAGTFTRDTVTAMDLAIQAQKDLADATKASTASNQFFESGAIHAAGEAARLGTAAAKTADSQDALAAAARGVERALDDQSAKLDALRANLSDDQAAYDLAAAFQAVRVSSLEAEAAIKDHADNASTALRQEATDTIALKQEIVDYGTEVLGLPADQVTNIVANVDDSQLDTLEKRLLRIRQNAEITASIILKGGAGYEGGVSGPRSVPVPSMSAAAAPARWARINGR